MLTKKYTFCSVHTYYNIPILRSVKRKSELRQKLRDITLERYCEIIAWVILDNHYHFLMRTDKGKDIQTIFKTIHGTTSFEWNREDNKRGRKIWHNYWDYCIRSEKEYWTRFNYIHYNPVKHRCVKRMEDYEFSSFSYYASSKGYEWLMSAFEKYPAVDYTVEGDEK